MTARGQVKLFRFLASREDIVIEVVDVAIARLRAVCCANRELLPAIGKKERRLSDNDLLFVTKRLTPWSVGTMYESEVIDILTEAMAAQSGDTNT